MSEQPYHPAEHSVDAVNDYLDDNPDQVATVLALEAEAETPRKGIMHGRHGAPAASAPEGKQVTLELRHHWTDNEGTAHTPGAKVTVDELTADQLVASRFAVDPEADKS